MIQMYKKPTNKLYSSPLKYKVSPDKKPAVRQSPQQSKTPNSQSTHALSKTFNRSYRRPMDAVRQASHSPSPSPSSKRIFNGSTTQKVSLTARRYYKHGLSSEDKLREVNSVFDFKENMVGTSSQKLRQLQSCNEEYIKLLNQWQKDEAYDECDRLVYTLVQNCIKHAEEVVMQLCKEWEFRCQQYEKLALEVIDQREQIVAEKEWKEEQLKSKFLQAYQKSQWSSFVLARLGRLIDMEGFMQGVHLQHCDPNEPVDLATLLVAQQNQHQPIQFPRTSPSPSQPPMPGNLQPQQWPKLKLVQKFAQ